MTPPWVVGAVCAPSSAAARVRVANARHYHRTVTVAIDIGNSAVKIARVVDGRVGEVLRLPTASPPSASLLAAHISAVSEAGAPAKVVAMVSVVPDWTELVASAVAALGLRLLTLDATRIGLPVRLPHPERVGTDRLLAAWTAVQEHGAPVVVVDLGTATTVDAVDASGAFVGGAIAPGPALSIDALAAGDRAAAAGARRAAPRTSWGTTRSAPSRAAWCAATSWPCRGSSASRRPR